MFRIWGSAVWGWWVFWILEYLWQRWFKIFYISQMNLCHSLWWFNSKIAGCNAMRCAALQWLIGQQGWKWRVAATSKSCVITMFMCDPRIFFSLISPVPKHFTDKTGGSFVLHLPIFILLGFWWDDHSRPQMCWDRSQLLPSQTPTNHPSLFVWLASFSVPKTNVHSLQKLCVGISLGWPFKPWSTFGKVKVLFNLQFNH